MMRSLVISIILVTGAGLKAQTIQQFTMYNLNHYMVNPAAAGNENYADIRMGYRKQWTGIDVAPSTYYVSGHTVLNRPKNYLTSAVRMSNSWGQRSRGKPMIKHAVGGFINSGEFGAFNRLEGVGTYALHLPLIRDISISMGLSAGFKSFSFDESKGVGLYTGDPVFDAYATSSNSNKFNMNTGVYAYSDKFYIGYSAKQIIRSKIRVSNLEIETGSERFEIYHYAMAGYHFDITNEIRLSPGFLLKKVGNNQLSYDINALLTYKQFLSAGVAYRSQDAVSVMFSYQINGLLKIGYSYDYNISEIRSVSNGSNELFIGVSIYSLSRKGATF